MKPRPLWRISLRTSPEAEEAATELLTGAFGQPASSYTDVETNETTVSAYFENKPAWSTAKQAQLAMGLQYLKASGLNIGPGRVCLTRLAPTDWAESWKRHFKPIAIGSALLIKPSWNRRSPRGRQAVVVLDPGLSFGTGQHPTTAFCLEQLVARRRSGVRQAFLDVGTGSGILAIAAAKLGYTPVHAFDFDPEAVRVARTNARQNGVSARIKFTRQDATRLPRRSAQKYAVVCANLTSDLLLAQRDRLLARLASGGVLVLAGILGSEFSWIQQAYERASLKLVAARSAKEWRSGAFQSV